MVTEFDSGFRPGCSRATSRWARSLARYYANARFYSAGIGWFPQPDSLVTDPLELYFSKRKSMGFSMCSSGFGCGE